MGTEASGSTAKACPAAMKATSNGIFQGDSPLDFALPLAIIQICLVLVVTRLLALFLRPMRQPRVVAEIVGGILLGPSALGRNLAYKKSIFPPRSLTVLDTLANIGLLFFLFLVGLEIDPSSLRRTGKNAIAIASSGMFLPFALGVASSFAFSEASSGANRFPFIVFMGVALSITAFGVLARILAELKLLTTDLGRIAMSAAALNDVTAWVLLALAVALSGNGRSPVVSLWVLLSGFAFVVLCVVAIPPVFGWVSRRCPEGEPVDEIYVCGALAVVLAAGFATDAIGIHVIFGAFVVGVLFPKGHFADAIVEKIEDLVTGLLLPLYFVSSGLKTDITTIHGVESWGLLGLVIATACFGKILGTSAVSLLCKIPFRDSLALGFLMNTKGLVELIVLNIGKDRKVLSDQTFAIMVLMALFTTFITMPSVMAIYKPAKKQNMDKQGGYKNRKIERDDTRTQLRMMLCLHSTRNIPAMISLVEASRGTEKKEGFCVYAMHLTELSERPSAILMVHKARKNGLPFWNSGRESNCDQVMVAFQAFRQLNRVSMRPMTAISPMSTIHEDICNSAERKHVAMIILPFHKHQRSSDGSFETTRTEFHSINKRVLESSPCSVGILVDRGLGGDSQVAASSFSLDIAVLFFGGHDDREALVYGLRMAEHPGVNLIVLTFSASPDFKTETSRLDIREEQETSLSDPSDEHILAEIKKRVIEQNRIRFEERSVKSPMEAVEIIREHCRCNLILVGRSPGGAVASGLPGEKIECPELGSIGNLLVSNEISTSASVLVVQQYTGKKSSGSVAVSARVAVAESAEEDE